MIRMSVPMLCMWQRKLSMVFPPAQVKIRVSTLLTAQAAVGDITEVVLNDDGEFEFSSGERVEAEEILTETTSENMIPLFLRGPYFGQ